MELLIWAVQLCVSANFPTGDNGQYAGMTGLPYRIVVLETRIGCDEQTYIILSLTQAILWKYCVMK